ncbi:alpha/beta fold hydrolase [Solwaraspora sp. WMMB335]|uniref:alpha/beta fold hydrolase n=1 Tax=Solwaraspora sp. WMMB335 TaxID=3404118 RepID=UPI003B93823F
MAGVRTSDGFNLWYEQAGYGPTLLFPVRRRAEYDDLLTALAQTFQVVRYKPRQMTVMEPDEGGGGPWEPQALRTYPIEMEINDLHAVADAVGADQFVLSGYSGTAALAGFLAPSSGRVAGVMVGGFPLLCSYDYWLGCVEGTRMACQSAGLHAQAELAWVSVLLYREWVARDDHTALSRLPGPKILWYGDRDSEPGCAMHDLLGGAAVAQRINAATDDLHRAGFDVLRFDGLDHLGAVQQASIVAPRLAAALGDAGWK